jgi:hypothetical protein
VQVLDGAEVSLVVCGLKCLFKELPARLLSFPNNEIQANEKEVKLDLQRMIIYNLIPRFILQIEAKGNEWIRY